MRQIPTVGAAASMTARRPAFLLTRDEANAVVVTALNTVTRTLTSRLPYRTTAALLHGRQHDAR